MNTRHPDWERKKKSLFEDDMIFMYEILRNLHQKIIKANKQVQQSCRIYDQYLKINCNAKKTIPFTITSE